MKHSQDPKEFRCTDDAVENNGSYQDEKRLDNPRKWGDDDLEEDDDEDGRNEWDNWEGERFD